RWPAAGPPAPGGGSFGGEDLPRQLQVAGLAGGGIALAQHAQGGLEAGAAHLAFAGDEAGGVLARGLDQLVVAGGAAGGRRGAGRGGTGGSAGKAGGLRRQGEGQQDGGGGRQDEVLHGDRPGLVKDP